MSSFHLAYGNTGRHEGGYVSPEIAKSIGDKGGETYKGIARNYHKNWGGWPIVDLYKKNNSSWQYYNKVKYFGLKHNSVIKDANLEKLHMDYIKKNFWDVNNLSGFKNQSLANYVFDIGFNSGVRTAARLLQRVLDVEIDGVIGSKTLLRLNSLNQSVVFNALKEHRKAWLDRNQGGKSYKETLDQRNDSFFFYRKPIGMVLITCGLAALLIAFGSGTKIK